MAWIIDPDFGHSLYRVPAVSPFPTGGGNNILSIAGEGVIYNDATSTLNTHLQADFANNTILIGSGGGSQRQFFGFIARRQVSGNFYFGGMAIDINGAKNLFRVDHYDAASNTLSTLGLNEVLESLPGSGTALHTLAFRLNAKNLAVIFDGETRLSVQNSSIASAGNHGIASINFSNAAPSDVYIDNVTFKNL